MAEDTPVYFKFVMSAKTAASAHKFQNIKIKPSNRNVSTILATTTDNIGIGTTTPSEKLEVNGTVKATSFEGVDKISEGN